MEEATEEIDSEVGSGQVTGGWEYVWAAYGTTWLGLVMFGAYIFLRGKK